MSKQKLHLFFFWVVGFYCSQATSNSFLTLESRDRNKGDQLIMMRPWDRSWSECAETPKQQLQACPSDSCLVSSVSTLPGGYMWLTLRGGTYTPGILAIWANSLIICPIPHPCFYHKSLKKLPGQWFNNTLFPETLPTTQETHTLAPLPTHSHYESVINFSLKLISCMQWLLSLEFVRHGSKSSYLSVALAAVKFSETLAPWERVSPTQRLPRTHVLFHCLTDGLVGELVNWECNLTTGSRLFFLN